MSAREHPLSRRPVLSTRDYLIAALAVQFAVQRALIMVAVRVRRGLCFS